MFDARNFTERDVIVPTRYLTRDQVRCVDQIAIEQFGMSGLVLMENAGRGCADVLCEVGIAGPVLICCGKGNNGGDGLVIARQLDVRGYQPLVLLACAASELKGDAAVNFAILRRTSVEIKQVESSCDWGVISEWFDSADWVVDALLGTGSHGEPRFPVDQLIRRANAATARKLAIDLPSGLDCDTGQHANETFRAAHTCTLVAQKAGFQVEVAKPFLGTVHVLDIGAPREVLEAVLAR
ncbi:MAG TPA: NAD(P)H-hydrate epimerase [Pirellulaceae bacterium]|jgi:NAD(P)H-hydrate epimerase|nr:NAD(P)H-hydrate epimerase [Pirellulaceae bacterium]